MSASLPLPSLLPPSPSPSSSPATLVIVAIALAALTIALFQAITLFLPSRSLLPPSPLPFAFDPGHRRSPTTVVAAAIALVAVACLHCRLNCCCHRRSRPLRHPPPSSPSPSPTFSPLPSPSSKGNKVYSVSMLITQFVGTLPNIRLKQNDQIRETTISFGNFVEMTIFFGNFVRVF